MRFFLVFIISIILCLSDVFAVDAPAAVHTFLRIRIAPPSVVFTLPAGPMLPGVSLVRPSVRSTTAPTTPNAIVVPTTAPPPGSPPPAPAAADDGGVPAASPAAGPIADSSLALGPCKIVELVRDTRRGQSNRPPATCDALQCYYAGGRCFLTAKSDRCVQHIRKLGPYGVVRIVKQGWCQQGAMRSPRRCGGCTCEKNGR